VNHSVKNGPSRRDVIKTTSAAAAASVLAGIAVPHVHAEGSNEIRVALVGCGGRGTGAAENALRVKNGPTKLVAMADVFPERLSDSYKHLKKILPAQVDVPLDKHFIGFDAYKKAMDCLRPGDVAIFATPPAFRWVHFTYAIEKGLNVFMEKPVAVDGPSCRKMFKLAEEAQKKNLKVGVGLMCRHCVARGQLFDRIKSGEIGDLLLLRAYRMAGVTAMEFSPPAPMGMSELLYQIKRFHSFLWASGGCYSDFLIHNIDECCWMKDAWPIQAKACGGRHFRGDNIDQNFDVYAVEYTFPDGAKLLLEGRSMEGCHGEFASYAHGTKGSAVISTSGHFPAKSRIFKGQTITRKDLLWHYPPENEVDPYQLEWEHLVGAIKNNKQYNEAKRGTEASLVTAMGRCAAHSGKIITWDDMLNHEQELAADLDKLTMDSPAPLRVGTNGKYPVPMPGKTGKREFERV
jgi:predicted dehydrogenase